MQVVDFKVFEPHIYVDVAQHKEQVKEIAQVVNGTVKVLKKNVEEILILD